MVPNSYINQYLYIINSSPPSATYMCQGIRSALAQIMACRLLGHYLNQCWVIVNFTFRIKPQGNFIQNLKFVIQENAFEIIVCEMAAILSRERWVKRPHRNLYWLNLFQIQKFPLLYAKVLSPVSWTVTTSFWLSCKNLVEIFSNSIIKLLSIISKISTGQQNCTCR